MYQTGPDRSRGVYALPMSQCILDGALCTPRAPITAGGSFLWRGGALRLDGPQTSLLLTDALGQSDLQLRVRRRLQRLIKLRDSQIRETPLPEAFPGSFRVGCGAAEFEILPVLGGSEPLFICLGGLPRPDRAYQILSAPDEPCRNETADDAPDIICFAQDTLIPTELGVRPVQELCAGDRIATRDDGFQELIWIGKRQVSGARLRALPQLRPIRLAPHALGLDRPDPDLLVSPRHRILVQGPVARALFKEPEVLVAAQDLVNDHSIRRDAVLREVTYYHLLLPRHSVIWANGVESESYHPADTGLDALEADPRARLLDVLPELAQTADLYGPVARRSLSTAEAAILRHGLR